MKAKAVILACAILSAVTVTAMERYPALVESLSVRSGLAAIQVFRYAVDVAPFIESAPTPSGPWSMPEQFAYADGFYWVIVTPAAGKCAFYRAWRKNRFFGLLPSFDGFGGYGL